jgi:hypothetical protein
MDEHMTHEGVDDDAIAGGMDIADLESATPFPTVEDPVDDPVLSAPDLGPDVSVTCCDCNDPSAIDQVSNVWEQDPQAPLMLVKGEWDPSWTSVSDAVGSENCVTICRGLPTNDYLQQVSDGSDAGDGVIVSGPDFVTPLNGWTYSTIGGPQDSILGTPDSITLPTETGVTTTGAPDSMVPLGQPGNPVGGPYDISGEPDSFTLPDGRVVPNDGSLWTTYLPGANPVAAPDTVTSPTTTSVIGGDWVDSGSFVGNIVKLMGMVPEDSKQFSQLEQMLDSYNGAISAWL